MADLNLAKFKKVAADKSCTTLRHENGHEIKIVHNALSPKNKKDLDRIPIHAAEGVEVPAQAEEPVAAAPESALAAERASAGVAPVSQEIPAAPVASTPAMPSAGMNVQKEQPPEDVNSFIQRTNDDMMTEHQNMAKDIETGEIKPKTYASLFADKSTLGKIGTIFGLMISGAGSGLAHQQNALLSAMDQQIKNDLDAQQKSVGNKQTWFTINNQKHLTDAQIEEIAAKKGYSQAQTTGLKLDNYFKGDAASHAGMGAASVHHLEQMVNGMPANSPSKPAAMNALGVVKNANAIKTAKMTKDAAVKSALIKQQYGSPDLSTLHIPQDTIDVGGDEDKGPMPEIPGDTILGPNAEQAFNSLKFNPGAQGDLSKVSEQFSQARKAERNLAQVHGIVTNLYDAAKKGGRSDYTRRTFSSGSASQALGGVGGGIGAATAGATGAGIGSALGAALGSAKEAMLGTPSEHNKLYSSTLSRLYAEIHSAVPNATHDDIAMIVKNNAPEYNDSPRLVAEKEANIKKFIMTNIQTGLLDQYHLMAKQK